MTAALIERDDHAYKSWLIANPSGFVANIDAARNKSYFVIHKATCSLITPGSARSNGPGAFTAHNVRKVVGDAEGVVDWGITHGYNRSSMHRCRGCNPSVESLGAGRGREYRALIAHPDVYDIQKAVETLDEDVWTLPLGECHAGDRLVMWQAKGSGTHRGVLCLAEVLEGPSEREEPPASRALWRGEAPPRSARRIRLRYVRPPNAPLWLGDDDSEVLSELTVSRGQGRKLFNVTDDQWERLLERLGGWADAGGEQASLSETLKPINHGSRRRGQGYSKSAAYRSAVEHAGMRCVRGHYEAQGWSVEDTSANRPYDFLCSRKGVVRYVEVKGTAGAGDVVHLTRNEVDHAARQPSNCVLAIVSGIVATSTAEDEWTATGGNLRLITPWNPREDGSLRAVAFRYEPEADKAGT